MAVGAAAPARPRRPPNGGRAAARRRLYSPPMRITANDVAAALRDHITLTRQRKLHALLYFCQGHHLAANDAPLFDERILATEDTVVVEGVDGSTGRPLGDAALAVVGLVASRYGGLTGLDLSTLATAQKPWRTARRAGTTAVIDQQWIHDWFVAAAQHPDGTATGFPRSHTARAAGATEDHRRAAPGDDPGDIAALIADVKARM